MRPGPVPRKRNYKKLILPIAILAVIGGLSLFIYSKANKGDTTDENSSDQPKLAEALNGTLVDSEVAQRRPKAIIIENHPDSRPQSGLSQADIVYETLAEGGITRYVALYQTQQAENIGPVRSMRIYFGDIADEWRSILVHVGGNSEALARLQRGEYKNVSDADQYFNGDFFRRVSSRPAPHNVYTSIKELDLLAASKSDSKYTAPASYLPWKFKDDAPAATPSAEVITVPFSTPQFTASYQYNKEGNNYLRYLAKQADRDAENKQQIAPKNVIIQFADAEELPTDAVGTLTFDLKSGGKALIFQDGGLITGTWRRENGRTHFYDASGNEVTLNRGQTWIEIVPKHLESTVSWRVATAPQS